MQLKKHAGGILTPACFLQVQGFPVLVQASNEGPGLYIPLFQYAVNDTRSGFADGGAGPCVVNGVSGACPLRRAARIPTSARPGACV